MNQEPKSKRKKRNGLNIKDDELKREITALGYRRRAGSCSKEAGDEEIRKERGLADCMGGETPRGHVSGEPAGRRQGRRQGER